MRGLPWFLLIHVLLVCLSVVFVILRPNRFTIGCVGLNALGAALALRNLHHERRKP